MITTYLLLLTSLLGSLLGLLGKSWDAQISRRIKLTRRGWASLAIICIGFFLTAIKTHQNYLVNQKLFKQELKVKKTTYQKIATNCHQMMIPLNQIYLENAHLGDINYNSEEIWSKVNSPSGLDVFQNLNLLDSIKTGTAFEEWDRSYADYLRGFYNSNYIEGLEDTRNSWQNFINLEDLLLIDSINHQVDATGMKYISYGSTNEERYAFKAEVGVLYYFDNDEDRLVELKRFINMVHRLYKRAMNISSQE